MHLTSIFLLTENCTPFFEAIYKDKETDIFVVPITSLKP